MRVWPNRVNGWEPVENEGVNVTKHPCHPVLASPPNRISAMKTCWIGGGGWRFRSNLEFTYHVSYRSRDLWFVNLIQLVWHSFNHLVIIIFVSSGLCQIRGCTEEIFMACPRCVQYYLCQAHVDTGACPCSQLKGIRKVYYLIYFNYTSRFLLTGYLVFYYAVPLWLLQTVPLRVLWDTLQLLHGQ